MNNSFILLDKTNNIQRIANIVIKFKYENKDYLVYCVDENEKNKQIFVSRLILNSEGRYFIDSITTDEKNKISNIVYNIVILTPTEYKKGNDGKLLIDNLSSKFLIKLSKDISELGEQQYYSNCSIAITSNELVLSAQEFYNSNLTEEINSEEPLIETWTIPTEIVSPVLEIKEDTNLMTSNKTIPTNFDGLSLENNLINSLNDNSNSMSNNDSSNNLNNNLNNENIINDISNISQNIYTSNIENIDKANKPLAEETMVPNIQNDVIVPVNNIKEEDLPNPQKEKLAIISDPSLSSIGIDARSVQPNMQNVKKGGFVVNKNIIIGTICLVLAIVVVVVTYFLIQNMK